MKEVFCCSLPSPSPWPFSFCQFLYISLLVCIHYYFIFLKHTQHALQFHSTFGRLFPIRSFFAGKAHSCADGDVLKLEKLWLIVILWFSLFDPVSSELVCTFYSRNQIDILNVAKQSSSKLTSSLVLHNYSLKSQCFKEPKPRKSETLKQQLRVARKRSIIFGTSGMPFLLGWRRRERIIYRLMIMTQSHKNADNRCVAYKREKKVKHDWIAHYQHLIGKGMCCVKWRNTSSRWEASNNKYDVNNKRADRAKQRRKNYRKTDKPQSSPSFHSPRIWTSDREKEKSE